MLRGNRKRQITWGAAIAAVLLASVPALSSSPSGEIEISSLAEHQAVAGTVDIEWLWRSGGDIDSTDAVNVFVKLSGTRRDKVASLVPIRQGTYSWDTTGFSDGVYNVRVRVAGSLVKSVVGPLYVDNSAPIIHISKPSTDQISVDDTGPDFAVVAGATSLEALAIDGLSGIASVTWVLDAGTESEQEIASGAVAAYDFSNAVGEHTLTAYATDFAGNMSQDSLAILALPGAAAIEGQLPDPSGGEDPGEEPEPGEGIEVPSPEPSLPEVPDLSEQPTVPDAPDTGEEPSVPGLPDTGEEPGVPTLPTPLPSP